VRGHNLVLHPLVVECDSLLSRLALIEVEVLHHKLVLVVVPYLQLLLFGEQAAPACHCLELLLRVEVKEVKNLLIVDLEE
jgi:hypothetical protein